MLPKFNSKALSVFLYTDRDTNISAHISRYSLLGIALLIISDLQTAWTAFTPWEMATFNMSFYYIHAKKKGYFFQRKGHFYQF